MTKKTKKSKVEGLVQENTNQTAEEKQAMEITQAEVEVVPATIVESSEAQVFTGQAEDQAVSTQGESQVVDSPVVASEGDTQPAEKPSEKKARVNKRPYIDFVVEHLMAGDCDRKELSKLIMEKFAGLSKGGVETFLTDAKNPKYSYFKDRPVIQHPKTGKLIFAEFVKIEAEVESGVIETPSSKPEPAEDIKSEQPGE